MLKIEVTRTTNKPRTLFRKEQAAFLSVDLTGLFDDLRQLQTALKTVAEDGGHSRLPAEMQCSGCEVFVFRNSMLLSVSVTDAGLILCGDSSSLRGVDSAIELCCGSNVIEGFHKHLEFGDLNGLGTWPLGILTMARRSDEEPSVLSDANDRTAVEERS
jgi:hypothetical protein